MLEGILKEKNLKIIASILTVGLIIGVFSTIISVCTLHRQYSKNLVQIDKAKEQITSLDKDIDVLIANNNNSVVEYSKVTEYIKQMSNVKIKSVTPIKIEGNNITPQQTTNKSLGDANAVEFVLYTDNISLTLAELQKNKLYYNSIVASILDKIIVVRIYVKEG